MNAISIAYYSLASLSIAGLLGWAFFVVLRLFMAIRVFEPLNTQRTRTVARSLEWIAIVGLSANGVVIGFFSPVASRYVPLEFASLLLISVIGCIAATLPAPINSKN